MSGGHFNQTKETKMNAKIINGKLKTDGDNGKEAFVIATNNDGFEDLRMTVDLDDCDRRFSQQWMKRVIQCVNACRGLENLDAVKNLPR